jgi:hypothetical protein
MKRLREIDARLRAATPGQWHAVPVVLGDGQRRTSIQVTRGRTIGYLFRFEDDHCADSQLIANAPDDLRYLISIALLLAEAPCTNSCIPGETGSCLEQIYELGLPNCWPCRVRKELEK